MKKITTLLLFINCVFIKIHAQEKTKNYTSPCLWVNATQLTKIKKDVKDTTLKLIGYMGLKDKADKYLKEPLDIPQQGGNWEQYYISPITNNVLTRGKLIGNYKWEHIDPITKQIFLGDEEDIEKDYDGVVIGFIHNTWALGLVHLGLAYQITSDTAYFNKAKQILLGYADLYPTLPMRTRSSKRLGAQGFGKIHVQDLNEAQWLVNMTEGADLIWDKLTQKERETISTQLLRPAVAVVNERIADTTNIQCWRNTATGMVGFLLQDAQLIQTAMDDKTGFAAQVKYGFNADGMTKDLSPNYQFFTLHPLCLLAQAAINNNYPVNIEPMHKMFATPIALSNPKLMLPPFNDSRPVIVSQEAFLYEWAYSKFKDSTFQEVLINPKRAYYLVESGYKFTGWNLLFGSPNLMRPYPLKIQSKNFDSTGVALLTKGKDNANLSCYVKYTNQTKNLRHFHNAQLDMAIIKGDEYITVMPGNLNYASPLSDGWYRSSVAHNTLVLNQKTQRRASAKCLGFGNTNGIDYVVAASTNIYVHDATFVRSVALLNENTVLVVDQFRTAQPKPAMFDLCYHQAGVFENTTKGEAWTVPDTIGYKYLTNASVNKQLTNFSFSTKLKTGRIVKTQMAASVATDFVTAYGKPFMKENVPMAMARVKTDSVGVITIAYCIAVNGKTTNITLAPNSNTDKKSFVTNLQIQDAEGKKMNVLVNPYKETVVNDGKTTTGVFEITSQN
jgi:oligo-alginate lyase